MNVTPNTRYTLQIYALIPPYDPLIDYSSELSLREEQEIVKVVNDRLDANVIAGALHNAMEKTYPPETVLAVMYTVLNCHGSMPEV